MNNRHAAVLSGVLLGALAAQAQSIFSIDFENLAANTDLDNSPLGGALVTPWVDLPVVNAAFIANAQGRAAWGADEYARVVTNPLDPSDALGFEVRNGDQLVVAAWEIRFDVVQNFIPTSISYDTSQTATPAGVPFVVAEAWTAEINGNPVGVWAMYTHTAPGTWEQPVLPLSGNTLLQAGDQVLIRTLVLSSGGDNGTRAVAFDNITLNGVVPEPSTYAALFALGLAGFAAYRRMNQA